MDEFEQYSIWTCRFDNEDDREDELEFVVSKSWAEDWFSRRIKGKYTYDSTYGIMESLEQWLNSYIADDSFEMYVDAKKENAIINELVLC